MDTTVRVPIRTVIATRDEMPDPWDFLDPHDLLVIEQFMSIRELGMTDDEELAMDRVGRVLDAITGLTAKRVTRG